MRFLFSRSLLGVLLLTASSLSAALTVSGHVTDQVSGLPIADARIALFSELPPDAYVQTDAFGAFQFSVLASTFYVVRASKDGYVTQTVEADVHGVSLVRDLVLTKNPALSGTVRDALTSAPVAGIRVTVADIDSLDIIHDSTISGIDGTYSFSVDPGTYGLCTFNASDIYLSECYDHVFFPVDGTPPVPTPVALAGGDQRTIDFSLSTGATIDGHLFDRYFGQPVSLSPMSIILYSLTGNRVDVDAATTTADGSYHISGVRPGSYYLIAQVIDPYYLQSLYGFGDLTSTVLDDEIPFSLATSVTVPAGGATGRDFMLQPGRILKGRITDATTQLGIPGVTLNVCQPAFFGDLHVIAHAATDAQGNFEIVHIPLVETTVETANGLSYVNKVWPDSTPAQNCSLFTLLPLNFIPFPTNEIYAGLDITLDKGVSVSGQLSRDGAGVAGNVILYRAVEQTQQQVWTGNADSAGNYRSDAQYPGTYFSAASTGQFCQIFDRIDCHEGYSHATPIELNATDNREHVDFPLPGELIFRSGFEN